MSETKYECPARKALESFAKIEIPYGCPDGTWVAKTIHCNNMVTAFQVRQAQAALSDPCPCEELRAEALRNLQRAGHYSNLHGHAMIERDQLRALVETLLKEIER